MNFSFGLKALRPDAYDRKTVDIFDVFFSSKVKYIACKTMVKP